MSEPIPVNELLDQLTDLCKGDASQHYLVSRIKKEVRELLVSRDYHLQHAEMHRKKAEQQQAVTINVQKHVFQASDSMEKLLASISELKALGVVP